MNGILYHKSKPFLGKTSILKKLFLQEYHDTPSGGHAGVFKTYKSIQQSVFWEGLKKDVTDYVSTCQQMKYIPH